MLMSKDQEIDQELLDKLTQTLVRPQINVQVDAAFATPYDAYTLLLETVRQTIPQDKIKQLIQARNQGSTLESALTVEFVYDLAYSELFEIFHSKEVSHPHAQAKPPLPPPPVQTVAQPQPPMLAIFQPNMNPITPTNDQQIEVHPKTEENKTQDSFEISFNDVDFD